jgi:hypothetical protein
VKENPFAKIIAILVAVFSVVVLFLPSKQDEQGAKYGIPKSA